MADNVPITAGTGTNFATDDIGSVHYPRAKLSLGADGTANDAVAGAGPVGTGVQRVTLASDDPAVTDLAAIEVLQTAANALLGTIDADTGNAVTALQIMDDWDESDRAKVNIIAGQAGVAGGSGTTSALTQRVVEATDSPLITAINSGRDYETVAASQTTQTLGATGAAGDFLDGLLLVVETAATSQVQIKDGANSAITVFPNSPGAGIGTYPVPLGLLSTNGAWQITTGAGVSVIAIGEFT